MLRPRIICSVHASLQTGYMLPVRGCFPREHVTHHRTGGARVCGNARCTGWEVSSVQSNGCDVCVCVCDPMVSLASLSRCGCMQHRVAFCAAFVGMPCALTAEAVTALPDVACRAIVNGAGQCQCCGRCARGLDFSPPRRPFPPASRSAQMGMAIVRMAIVDPGSAQSRPLHRACCREPPHSTLPT